MEQVQQTLLKQSLLNQQANQLVSEETQHIWKDMYSLTHLDQQNQNKPEKSPNKFVALTLYIESKDGQKTSTG